MKRYLEALEYASGELASTTTQRELHKHQDNIGRTENQNRSAPNAKDSKAPMGPGFSTQRIVAQDHRLMSCLAAQLVESR